EIRTAEVVSGGSISMRTSGGGIGGANSGERFFQLRQDREQVAHQANVGDLEDRRLRVLVDRHDRAGVLDARQVLDSAGNADGQVQLRGDDLAGLTDLHLVRAVA